MATEKNPQKDILLWIITVVLIALAIYWYKREVGSLAVNH